MAIDANGNYVAEQQQILTTPPPLPAPPTASTVYSAPNIAQAVTAPVAPPNLSDPMGIYDYYMKGADVTAAQNQSIADHQALAKAKATAQSRQLAIEGNPLESQQFIVGAQSRAGQLDSATLSALADAAGVSQSAYLAQKETATQKANIAMEQRNELTKLIASNPGAKISYTDSYESAVAKADKYQKDQAEQAKKDAYKDSLKSTALQLGIKTKGKSISELEKSLKKYYKSEQDYKNTIKTLELAAKQKSASGGGAKPNELKATADAFAKFGGDWGKTANYLANQGYNVASGSAIDNELRRRNGLPAIGGKSSGASSEAQKLMDSLGVSESVAEAMIKQEMGL